jgi:glucosamine--fructose-6-phosphate aminotransferase (isomerizing)
MENPEQRTFAHAMLREIWEQPDAVRATLEQYVSDGTLKAEAFLGVREWLAGRHKIVIAASGSSRHAGLEAELVIEDMTGVAVDVEYASEYCYRGESALRGAAAIVISQSGETADTLAALRKAKAMGLATLAITNHPGSSMAREATVSLPTFAGVEKAIPATKSFVTQLVVLYLLTVALAREMGELNDSGVRSKIAELEAIPAQIERQLARWTPEVERAVALHREAQTFLYLGRGVHYAIAREGALKLKESSYLHAEGYPAGELKHGPNALVSSTVPLVVVATVDRDDADSVMRYDKTLQLLRDMQAQGADVLAIANADDAEIAGVAQSVIGVEPMAERLLPICEVIPLQMFAYYMAVAHGIDVDRPRNLVKAVVTE